MSDSLLCSSSACGIIFSTKEEKRRHEISVHRPKVHCCEKCGKTFRFRGLLNDHVVVVHDKKSLDIKCNLCDEVFTKYAMRDHHRNIVHFPNKFKCEICTTTFGSSQKLKRHGIVHSGERNFPCQDCDRKFKTKQVLVDHKRSHTGEKPFACKHCPYRGATSSLLHHHKRQKHKAEFEDERKQKEKEKIKISKNVQV